MTKILEKSENTVEYKQSWFFYFMKSISRLHIKTSWRVSWASVYEQYHQRVYKSTVWRLNKQRLHDEEWANLAYLREPICYFAKSPKKTQQQLHHIFFKTETVQDFKTLDLFKVPWQIFLSLIDNDLMLLDFQNHSHFFCFCFPTLYFSVGVVQRDISIGFSDTLVIVTVQIAPACSILHQHCLPNTI